MTLTQSFLKQVQKYAKNELCGHIINHCFVLGKFLPPSKAMKVGIYFEFMLTGSLPKDGQVPRAEYMKNKNEMKVPYRKAVNDANYIKAMLDKLGLKMVRFGAVIKKDRFGGTIDIICVATRDLILGKVSIKKGEEIVIDVKYSGLLKDRYIPMGWMFTDIQKEYHKIQAIQYHMVTGLRFFYLVVDSSHNEKDDDGNIIPPPFEIFHTPIDEFMVEQQKLQLLDAEKTFNYHKDIGFTPRPVFKDCEVCPLNEGCKDRALLPEIKVIDLNVD